MNERNNIEQNERQEGYTSERDFEQVSINPERISEGYNPEQREGMDPSERECGRMAD